MHLARKKRPRQSLVLLIHCVSILVASDLLASIEPILVFQKTSAHDSQVWKQEEVQCPAGWIAFTGGVSPVLPSSTAPLFTTQSLPVGDPPNAWSAIVQRIAPTAPEWSFKVWVLCAEIPGYELVTATSVFDDSDHKIAAAHCPPGKKVIGGGGGIFGFSPDTTLSWLQSFDEGWSASAVSRVVAGNWILQASASCAPVSEVQRFEVRVPHGGDDRTERLQLTCPEGLLPVSAGSRVSTSQGLGGRFPLISEIDGFYGWEVVARRYGSGMTLWTQWGSILCLRDSLFVDGFESGDLGSWTD